MIDSELEEQKKEPKKAKQAAGPQLSFIVLGIFWFILAASLLYSQYRPSIIITWSTETEFDTAGFNIYRSVAPGDEDCEALVADDYDLITDELIPGSDDPESGGDYEYRDKDVKAGLTYCYQLEDTEFSSRTERHQPLIAEAAEPELWAITLAAASTIIGLLLIITGIKQDKQR